MNSMTYSPTPEERNYRERGRLLLHASESESDPILAFALAKQSERIYMKAVRLEAARKQNMLQMLGVPSSV